MPTASPRLYRTKGLEANVSDSVINAATSQIKASLAKGLPPILTLKHLSLYSETQYYYLRSIVSRRLDPYHVFKIRKRSAGYREVCAPHTPLMQLQRWINKNILQKTFVHEASFAFASDSSILGCAANHCGSKWIVKLDIEKFFECFTEIEIYKVFRGLGYNSLISFELSRLCTRVNVANDKRFTNPNGNYSTIPQYTYEEIGYLPQGAPTSPMLANIAFIKLDDIISAIAQKHGMIYTRYADDMTFSSNNSQISRKVCLNLIASVSHILNQNGFCTNKNKTKIIPPGGRKIVLGLNVSEATPRLTRRFKSRLETHLRGLEKFGPAAHCGHFGFESIWGLLNHLSGLLAFAKQVESEYAHEQYQKYNSIVSNIFLLQ